MPVATDLKGLRQLQARASAARLVCMPGHNYAYVPEIARLGRLVREGRLGRIRLLSVVFAIAHEEAVAAKHDGALRVVMPHHAYLAHGLLGTPARVHAGVTEPGWASLQQEDQCWMALEYPPLATALLFCSMAVDDDSADPWTFVVKVLGTEGSASATWRAGVWKSSIGTLATGYAPYSEAYERQLEAFCRAVRGEQEAILSPLEHAVGAERILAAAERAIAHGAPTSLQVCYGRVGVKGPGGGERPLGPSPRFCAGRRGGWARWSVSLIFEGWLPHDPGFEAGVRLLGAGVAVVGLPIDRPRVPATVCAPGRAQRSVLVRGALHGGGGPEEAGQLARGGDRGHVGRFAAGA
jgi:hypothetical protein